MALVVLSTKAIASLSSLEPPAGHRFSGQTAGEDLFAGAACRIHSDGLSYLSSANAASNNANVHGFAARSVKAGGSITLIHSERFFYTDVAMTPGAPLFLSGDVTKKGRLDTVASVGSPLPCAFVQQDGNRIYTLMNVGMWNLASLNAEQAALLAALPVAAIADLAGVNLTAVPGAFADEAAVKAYLDLIVPAIETRLDDIEAKVNEIITKFEGAGLITP